MTEYTHIALQLVIILRASPIQTRHEHRFWFLSDKTQAYTKAAGDRSLVLWSSNFCKRWFKSDTGKDKVMSLDLHMNYMFDWFLWLLQLSRYIHLLGYNTLMPMLERYKTSTAIRIWCKRADIVVCTMTTLEISKSMNLWGKKVQKHALSKSIVRLGQI